MSKKTNIRSFTICIIILVALINGIVLKVSLAADHPLYTSGMYEASPPFVTSNAPVLVMLVMGRNHKLYYEAYNDASDLNGDGEIDAGYNPDFDYYGYFDSHLYYQYSGVRKQFEPVGQTGAEGAGSKNAPNGNYWSGDFLNYLTMTRMDCIRKILYGGYRSTDTDEETVLERAYVPQDAHSWCKEYRSVSYNRYDIRDYTPLDLPFGSSRHLFANTTPDDGDNPPELRVLENSAYRAWHWVAGEGNPAGETIVVRGINMGVTDNSPAEGLEDAADINKVPTVAILSKYLVRVKVCDEKAGLESNAKKYPGGPCKPIGILQRHGEPESMYFGLITGSYDKNMSGGVLRKNISSINDEIDPYTGYFKSINGIVRTINALRIYDYNYDAREYSGGLLTGRRMVEAEFPDWGNPVAEMMVEALRYFAGETVPNPAFDSASVIDERLGLPVPAWRDPYDDSTGFPACSRPMMLVFSDVNPSYDSDQIPGSHSIFGSMPEINIGNADTALNAATIADEIFDKEGLVGLHEIGQQGLSDDRVCTRKTVNSFGDIRGLCPGDPAKEGSYYSAAVAHYGFTRDLSAAKNKQAVTTCIAGIAPPFQAIEIPAGGGLVTLVPFGKKISTGNSIINGNATNGGEGGFQPSMTMTDMFVEKMKSFSGTFRVSFYGAEQGGSFDMDAVVRYDYQVYKSDGITPAKNDRDANEAGAIVKITVTCIQADMEHRAHLGYIISGTGGTDGIYLEVRDMDHPEESDASFDYYLDTPDGELPGGVWNDHKGLPLHHIRTFIPQKKATGASLKNPLWYAAKWGWFNDKDGNSTPTVDKDTSDTSEWDNDGDGYPDNYFYVTRPSKLEKLLGRSMVDIHRRPASGTAASVISTTRSGEGIICQSMFFPEYKDNQGNTVAWCSDVYALFVDAYGNMREDTNKNGRLDIENEDLNGNGSLNADEDSNANGKLDTEDRIIVFDGGTSVTDAVSIKKYRDADENCVIDDEHTYDRVGVHELNFLWTTAGWLNEISDAVSQRTYRSTEAGRYIFTFVDKDRDMVTDSGEQVSFSSISPAPSVADLVNRNTIYPYVQTYPISETANASLLAATKNVIDYIRGKDRSGFRQRQADYDNDGTVETWRLGDIVHSSPVFVNRPAEAYHMLYGDESYGNFCAVYHNRRGVVYTGANDGMFHAFNAGFYDMENKAFEKTLTRVSRTEFELGAELWAYVPFNLLPHLYWLTRPDYSHIYYCDLKPKIFDAKIFPADANHPDGWGTVLVGGMRFGGGAVTVDMDKSPDTVEDRLTMVSAYFMLDITNPEEPPELLGEISFPNLGYTTCYPAVIPMKKDNQNEWYLVLGSGPKGASGIPGVEDKGLTEATSNQEARLYVIDLKKLATDRELWALNSNGMFARVLATDPADTHVFQKLDVDSFVSDPVSADFNLDYSMDTLYFGVMSGDEVNGWGGKLRRVVIDNEADAALWDADSILLDLGPYPEDDMKGRPITSAPAVAVDPDGNRWVYFGTGRQFVQADFSNSDPQAFYGIKDVNGETVTETEIVNVTDLDVFEDGSVIDRADPIAPVSWLSVKMEIDSNKGWCVDFETATPEKNIGQSALLGNMLVFNTFTSSEDVCANEGRSHMYALHYLTGTPYFEPAAGFDKDEESDFGEKAGMKKKMKRRISLGKGFARAPNFHTGREKGSKTFVQTSTGAIQTLQLMNPGRTKSGMSSWKEIDIED